MKSLNAYLKESRYPELAQKVINQMDLDFREIIERPYDFQNANAGVSGFIYYSETTEFAKSNLWAITKALNEWEQELGEPIKKPIEDETQYLNWLAWFALEIIINEIIQFTE